MSLLRAQELNNNLDILPKHVGRPKFFFKFSPYVKEEGFRSTCRENMKIILCSWALT
jgi:hypothetical protein